MIDLSDLTVESFVHVLKVVKQLIVVLSVLGLAEFRLALAVVRRVEFGRAEVVRTVFVELHELQLVVDFAFGFVF